MKGRLGLIIPSSNTTVEPEFIEALPKAFTLHFSRIMLHDVTLGALLEMNKEIARASKELASAKVDVIAYTCTSGSFYGGLGHDLKVSKTIREETGIESVTTSTAIIEAMRRMGMRRLNVITPYVEEVNARLLSFLEENGFSVSSIRGMGIASNLDIGEQPPERVKKFALEEPSKGSDGMLLSCTNLRSMSIIEALELETGKPVVSANQATLWMALKALGYREPIIGYGRLLREHLGA